MRQKLNAWKITAIVLASIIGLFLVIVLGYVGYVVLQYNRIPDNQIVDMDNNQSLVMSVGDEYTIATYNVGFGAYDQEFDFFMDTGKLKDEHGGTDLQGTRGKAVSRENVIKNTKGSIDSLIDTFGEDGELDFILFQEVDTKADRSHHVNQYEMMREAYAPYNMGSYFAVNFHSANLLYPFHDPHGKSVAGLATFSKYKVNSSVRRQYPISTAFSKFFDLDRCFVVSRVPVNGDKELVLINSHMSAYDEGGVYRTAQLKMLNDILASERQKGNYVIVGGDFNHDIADSKATYPSWEVIPDESVGGWLYQLFDGKNVVNKNDPTHSDLAEGYTFATTLGDSQDESVRIPTCRCCEMPYERDENGMVKNYQAVLDGFIVSDNIEVKRVRNIDTDFKYSDHNPVKLIFALK